MYFTDEEKEIIRKIAQKEVYSMNDFFEDNFPNRGSIEIKSQLSISAMDGWSNLSKLSNFNVSSGDEGKIYQDEYHILIIKFIKIWNVLKGNNLAVEKSINYRKISLNFKNFLIDNSVSKDLCIDFESYCINEILVIQEQLKDFITNDFKTKDEIHMEKALNSADKSFKVSLWIAGISIFLSILSITLSVFTIVKESEVRVKNLNEIKLEKLEKQLETTNKELEDIKGLLNQKKKM